MIVLRVASESIWNMNETKDSNKNRNEICKMMKQHQICWICWKYTARNEKNIKKAYFKRWREIDLFGLSPILEPKVNDVQLS
jgi:penicillin-binding protein-related factor A (putative recombinase)